MAKKQRIGGAGIPIEGDNQKSATAGERAPSLMYRH